MGIWEFMGYNIWICIYDMWYMMVKNGTIMVNGLLVGGFNHLEKYENQWEGLSHISRKINQMFQTTSLFPVYSQFNARATSMRTWPVLGTLETDWGQNQGWKPPWQKHHEQRAQRTQGWWRTSKGNMQHFKALVIQLARVSNWPLQSPRRENGWQLKPAAITDSPLECFQTSWMISRSPKSPQMQCGSWILACKSNMSLFWSTAAITSNPEATAPWANPPKPEHRSMTACNESQEGW